MVDCYLGLLFVHSPGTANLCAICRSAVCLEVMERTSQVYDLPCHHAYHCQCLEGWVSANHMVCPLCRESVLGHGRK